MNHGTRTESAIFATKELSNRTWPDFVKLFKKPGEWALCQCMYYQRARPLPRRKREALTSQQWTERNRREKRELVRKGHAHGILVYSRSEPVGWCQYGPKEELPRIDAGRKYKAMALDNHAKRVWRITCFSVDRKHRHQGVASIALSAALRSIRNRGGGIVEAYPATHRGALALWFGTVSMFRREGFRIVAPFGRSNVLMSKTI